MKTGWVWGEKLSFGTTKLAIPPRTLQKFIQYHSVEESGVFVSSLFVNQQVRSVDFSLIPVGEIENPISGGDFRGK